MLEGLHIFEDFYENPDEVRDYALTLDFNVVGNYPGARTKSYYEEQQKKIDNRDNLMKGMLKNRYDDLMKEQL